MPSRLGEPSGFGSLYTYLVAPAWWLDPTDAWEAAKLIGVLVMTAAIFPAYGLARFVVSRPWAIAAAIGAVAAPPLAYAPYLLEEPLAYPFSTTALWAVTAAVARPTWRPARPRGRALPRRPVRPRRAGGAAGRLRRRPLRAPLADRPLHAVARGLERRRLGRRGDARGRAPRSPSAPPPATGPMRGMSRPASRSTAFVDHGLWSLARNDDRPRRAAGGRDGRGLRVPPGSRHGRGPRVRHRRHLGVRRLRRLRRGEGRVPLDGLLRC